MKRSVAVLGVIVLGWLAACSGGPKSNGFGSGGSGGADGSGGGGTSGVPGGGSGGGGGSSGIMLGGGDGGEGGTMTGPCMYMDSTDHDGDGWSFTDGDCNDCDPTVNPGAYDIPKDGIDEDCDGVVDDEPTGCDTGLAIDSSDANDAAKAIDICRQTTEGATGKARTWGVVNAEYLMPDGTTMGTNGATTSSPNYELGHGLLSAFGVNNTQQGVAMLGLSSGTARQPTDPGYQNVSGFSKGYASGAPAGYPKPAPACPGVVFGKPHDGAALQLTIRVPTNAKTLSFDQNFFSFEFPQYVCSPYNDTYVVMMAPKTTASLPDDNIAFDTMGNPISVNNALVQVCEPQTIKGRTYSCPLGITALTNTGFDQKEDEGPHAATGWLTTTAPVESVKGQDITLLFAIWDSTDGILDSSVIIDNVTWGFVAPMPGGPVTMPTPAPK